MRTIDEELKTDPYTVSTRSLNESARGLYTAMLNNVSAVKSQIALIEAQI